MKPDGRIVRYKVKDYRLTMHVHNLSLRRTWFDALVMIRDFGPQAWYDHVRGRGSRHKMFRRMVYCGYVTPPPFAVTPAGHRYIRACKDRFRWPDHRNEMIPIPIFKDPLA